MKRIILTLILSTLFFMLSAQDIDRDCRIMDRVMADTDKYSYASASHDTLEVAVKNAVAMLASQIVTDVKVQAKSEIHSVTGNGDIEERLFYDQIAETFTNVRLKDYHTLVVAKPDSIPPSCISKRKASPKSMLRLKRKNGRQDRQEKCKQAKM